MKSENTSAQKRILRFLPHVIALLIMVAFLCGVMGWHIGRAANADGVEAGVTVINGHRFVDLGLPSGLLWAENNVGAAKPDLPGFYFAFGETKTKADFSWATYKWGTDADSLTKYTATTIIPKLDSSDDVATVMWGGDCRMPTADELNELIEQCVWTWDDLGGFWVKSKANGRSIFLPASGYYDDKVLCRQGSGGLCWSSIAAQGGRASAIYFDCGGSGIGLNDVSRNLGLTVRPVSEGLGKN